MTNISPSPTAIVYATADLFAPPPHGVNGSENVPCTALKVAPWDLCEQLICVALADMMYQGLITLQIVEATKLLVIHTKNVVLHITPEGGGRLPQTGVGGWLARSILAHNGDNIHNIIRAAYGQDYPSPSSVPIYVAAQELVSLGYYQDTEQEISGVGGMLRKAVHASTTKHINVPICERFAALRPIAPSVQQMLQAVSSHDTVLWEMLHKQISHAMTSRVERERDTNNSGDF